MAKDQTLPASVTDRSLRRFAGYNMKRAYVSIRAENIKALEPLGLRMVPFTALALVGENPGLSQSQLAQAMAVERPNLVAVLDALESRGLICRDRLPSDRRVQVLTLTGEGEALLAEATERVARREAGFVAGLAPEEAEALVTTLNQIEFAAGRS